ncbi:MAG TPA: aromatic ring-hydroxylating dioxygenase subunit alpha [Steroidobacteraceae bacterium]|nr:aromatic ring-hydroxylating dioxygenase subunit alpha [Steroidobacteraceae bacterium]
MQSSSEIDKLGYNGLTEHTEGLPADAYFDPRQYERELQRVWYRNWVYVGRSSDVGRARAFRTFELGDQKILLVRDDRRVLQGFHNTCRHRGAALCRETDGQLRSGTIVCPYHAWVYNLQGDLLRTSSKAHASGFDVGDYPLYKISVKEWNGFIFVALSDNPPLFEKIFDLPLNRLDAWPLGELAVGHVLLKTIHSNWKIFWENYNECLHCPGVHPQLSQLVPIYGRGLLEERDDPEWGAHAADSDPKFKGGLRSGAATWSLDGKITGIPFPRISDADRQAGHIYMTGLPSVFLVGHIDYVRVVRLLPLGPELTELRVEYLFSPQTLADPQFDIRNVVDFTNLVMTEDAAVCELNQSGLRAGPHARGVVMPEEYVIRQFHEWLRAELARV